VLAAAGVGKWSISAPFSLKLAQCIIYMPRPTSIFTRSAIYYSCKLFVLCFVYTGGWLFYLETVLSGCMVPMVMVCQLCYT